MEVMTMETKVNYAIVGAFVISLFTAIVFSIIWLSSGFSFQTYKTYRVYMQESVSGLAIDSLVEYNGVDVGKVKSIQLNHNNPQLVELLLSINEDTPITRGTVATLNSRGITGITFIALKDKSMDLRPLQQEKGEPYPVIPTAPSLFVRLDTALSELSNNFEKIASSFQTLFDEENQQSVKTILANLREVTDTFAKNNQKLDVIMDNTMKLSHQLMPLVQSSTRTLSILEAQTLPTTYKLLSNLDEMTRTLSELSMQIKQNPAILVRGVQNQQLGPGEKK